MVSTNRPIVSIACHWAKTLRRNFLSRSSRTEREYWGTLHEIINLADSSLLRNGPHVLFLRLQ